MKRRVVAIWGSFEAEDFVLEPSCSNECDCDICKDSFWIEKLREK